MTQIAEQFRVGDVANLAGITVRTLHHYDEIGLVRPSQRASSGYRQYAAADIDRLAEVLGYRELGFGLDEIRAMLDDPTGDRSQHLSRQRQLLTERIARLRRIVAAIDTTLEAQTVGSTGLTPAEKLEVFGDFDPDEHAEQAQQRWGDTDAYRQSAARTKKYTKQDWQAIMTEGSANTEAMAHAMRAGRPATSAEAMDAAEQARQHISRWYYDCAYEMHRNLGDMYISDERFTATYEKVAPGLAQYVRDAIHANADRQR